MAEATRSTIQTVDNTRWDFAYAIVVTLVAASIPFKSIIINSVTILMWCGVIIADIIFHRRFILPRWKIYLVFSSFFFLTVLSILYSQNMNGIGPRIETRLSIAALPLLFMLSRVKERFIPFAYAAFAIVCIAISILCAAHIFYTNYSNGIAFSDATSWYFSADFLVEKFGFHPSYFAIYCAFTAFILVDFYKKKQLNIIVLLSAIVYLAAFMLLLASRVGLAAFVAVSLATILYEAAIRKKLLRGVALMILFGGVMLVAILNTHITREKFNAMFGIGVHQYNETFMMTKRFELWIAATKVFSAHPIAGAGVGDMQNELMRVYSDRNFQEGLTYEYNPHNLFLDTAASLGILGLVTLLVLFGYSFIVAFKSRNVLHLQLLLLFLTISLVEATFSVQKGLVFFTFFNVLACLPAISKPLLR